MNEAGSILINLDAASQDVYKRQVHALVVGCTVAGVFASLVPRLVGKVSRRGQDAARRRRRRDRARVQERNRLELAVSRL